MDALSSLSITSVPFVWNRLWLHATNIAPAIEPWKDNRYLARIPVDAYAELLVSTSTAAVDRVFVPTLALPRFVRRVLPAVHPSRRMVIISGLADAGPGATLLRADSSGELLSSMLSDKRVLRWHAENLDFAAINAFPIPIGIDFHTLAWKASARPQWGPAADPLLQAQQLARAAAAAADCHIDRRCYIHWGYVSSLRSSVSTALCSSSACFVDPSPPGTLPRAELWRRMSSFRWVASIAGAGIDCHRTWEALALGCGVVVQDCTLLRTLLEHAEVPVLFVPGFGAAAPESEAAEWAAHVTQAALDTAWDAWAEKVSSAQRRHDSVVSGTISTPERASVALAGMTAGEKPAGSPVEPALRAPDCPLPEGMCVQSDRAGMSSELFCRIPKVVLAETWLTALRSEA